MSLAETDLRRGPDGRQTSPAATPAPRSGGVLRLELKRRGDATVLGRLYQSGCLKARLFRPEPRHCAEAVLLNTSGGLVGGDRLFHDISWGPATHAAVTTPAAEKLYRAASCTATVETVLSVAEGATAEWLPQEAIVFDRAMVKRDLQVRLAVGATFTGVESIVLGRAEMGETVRSVWLRDGWRVWRGDRLIYADAFYLGGEVSELLVRAPTLQGHLAFANLLHIGPRAEAELQQVRDFLADSRCIFGASAWNGMLSIRLVARDGATLRQAVARALGIVRGNLALPRVWQM
ncbi:MAG: urease accessory protein UreD [Rhizomicrobium sp.]